MEVRGLAQFELLSGLEYFAALARDIENAERRVSILVLLLALDATTASLFEAFQRAAERGVQVTIVYDAQYTKLYFAGRNGKHRRTFEALRLLQDIGVVVRGNAPRSLNPLKGRYHAKVSIVDDVVYSFGGVNLVQKAIHNADYMLRSASPPLADRLNAYLSKLVNGTTFVTDWRFSVEPHSQVIVDRGVPGRSAIYEAACEMIQDAEKVWYLSQFCPTGRLAKMLNSRDSTFYFNRSRHSNVLVGTMLAVDVAATGVHTAYHGRRYLHAKLIIARSRSGRLSALSTSHNFKMHGVRSGPRQSRWVG